MVTQYKSMRLARRDIERGRPGFVVSSVSQTEGRLTLPRLLAFGIFALRFKKGRSVTVVWQPA